MNKPSKDNIKEPILSPIKQKYDDKSIIKKIIAWRTHNRHFQFIEDYIVWVESIQLWVKIPAGFLFDGASIPKLLQSVTSAIDSLFYGSILHDFIYRTGQLIVCNDANYGCWHLKDFKKDEADSIMAAFSDQMEGVTTPSIIVKNMLGVFGWVAWGNARKRNMRITTPYPPFNDKTLNYYN